MVQKYVNVPVRSSSLITRNNKSENGGTSYRKLMNQSMFHISEVAQKLVKVNVILENDYTQQSQRKID